VYFLPNEAFLKGIAFVIAQEKNEIWGEKTHKKLAT